MKVNVRELVEPKAARGWNLAPLSMFGVGPKWTITCGACGVTFRKRLPIVEDPGVACTTCGAVNIIPVAVGEVESRS